MRKRYEYQETGSESGWEKGFVELYDDESDTPDMDYEAPVNMMGNLEDPDNTVLFLASMHGDEYLSSRICMEMMGEESLKDMSGRAVFMPCFNLEGMFQQERLIPRGGGDLNRAFERGVTENPESYTDRVGAGLLEFIDDMADVVVDVHCWTYNSDAFVVTERPDPNADTDTEWFESQLRRICDAFQMPATISDESTSYLISALMNEREVPAVIFEIGPKGTTPHTDHEILKQDLRNVMVEFGVMEGEKSTHDGDYDGGYLYERQKVYSDTQGMVIEEADLHTELEKGERIARVVNRFGETKEVVEMPDDGIITAFVDHKMVVPGDEICHTGLRKEDAFSP